MFLAVWQPWRWPADPAAFVHTWAAAPGLVSAGRFTCEPEKWIWQPRADWRRQHTVAADMPRNLGGCIQSFTFAAVGCGQQPWLELLPACLQLSLGRGNTSFCCRPVVLKNLYKCTCKTCSGLCQCPRAGTRSWLDARDPPPRAHSRDTLSDAHLGLRQPGTSAHMEVLRDWAPGHPTHRQTRYPDPSCYCTQPPAPAVPPGLPPLAGRVPRP